MNAEQLLTIITPLVVYGVVELVKWILPKVSGWVIVSCIVPLLSALATFATEWFTGASGFWPQFVVGLLAVFVNELIRQLRQATPSTQ